jgi:hypothetical protein
MLSVGFLATSRRPRSQSGQILGDGRLIFKLPLMRSVQVIVAPARAWNVCFWHLADIGLCAANVRSREQSGHHSARGIVIAEETG